MNTNPLRAPCCFLLLCAVSVAQAQLDTALFSGMKARSIGPAGMSGRIGGIDAVIANPEIMYVGVSTGGVWKTTNSGTTWKPIFDTQPVAAIGSVAIFQPNPAVVWVGTGEGNPRNSVSVGNGIYKSIDGGQTWSHMGLDRTERIHRILLHPGDPNVAYVAAMGQMWGENPERGVYKTTDGGKTFSNITPGNRVHSDHHALWINPLDGSQLIDGNDGGLAVSNDRGKTWRFVENLPLGQFYHINVDMEIPYNIYGGMQDNGSWRGPGEVWENGGIRNWHWNEVGFGDGFATLVDASDANSGYAMSQAGGLIRFNRKTGERKDIRPWGPDEVELRFNWNAGIASDPFDPKAALPRMSPVQRTIRRF